MGPVHALGKIVISRSLFLGGRISDATPSVHKDVSKIGEHTLFVLTLRQRRRIQLTLDEDLEQMPFHSCW
jgi:hypothetical protein